MSNRSPESVRRLRRLHAVWMMVVGGLMVLLCGLCSLGVQLSTVPEPKGAPGAEFYDAVFYIGMAVIGGVPMLVGAGLFGFGFIRHRMNRPSDD